MSIVEQLWHFARRINIKSWLGPLVRARAPSVARQIADQLLRSPGGKSMVRHRREEFARERKAIAADAEGLVEEIRAVGYRVNSLHDLIYQRGPCTPGFVGRGFKRRFVGPYRNAYPILARHLFVPHEPLVRRCIASALARKDVGDEIEAQLLRAMNAEPDKDVQASMATSVWLAMGPERATAHPEIEEIRDARSHENWMRMAGSLSVEPGSEISSSPYRTSLGPIGPEDTRWRVRMIVGDQTLRGVEVTPVGEGLFRLEQVPSVFVVWCEGNRDPNAIPKYGDTIAAKWVGPTTISYVSIHARGPYRHHSYLLPFGVDYSSKLPSFVAQVEAEGGHVEVHMKGSVQVALPAASKFDPAGALKKALAETPHSN